jgi:hypothetical protein
VLTRLDAWPGRVRMRVNLEIQTAEQKEIAA